MLDVNTFWTVFKLYMHNRELEDHIEDVWAFLEEHSRTVIAEDVLDEARNEVADEAHEIGREEGYEEGHDGGYEEGYQAGYSVGYDDARAHYA